MSNDRKLIVSFLATFAVATLSVMGINAYFDPYGFFGSGRFPIVELRRDNFNLKSRLIQHLPEMPSILILGSSVVLKFDPEEIRAKYGKMAFNAGVSGGTIEDSYSLLERFFARFPGGKPQIVWALDVESLVDASLENHETRDTGETNPWIGLLNTTELVYSIRYLFGFVPKDQGTFTNLGFRTRDVWDRLEEGSKADLDEERRIARHELLDVYQKNSSLNPDARLWVERTLEAIAHRGAKLAIYLSPVEPGMLQEVSSAHFEDRHREAIEFLNGMKAKYGFTFVDLTEIRSFSGTSTDFYDGVHMKRANISRVLEKLRTIDAL